MKRFFALIIFTIVTLTGNTAQAGIPVIDKTAIVQAIQQVLAWQQQYQQMVQQYQQLQQQYASLTGSRGLGDIINNPALHGVVPADVKTVYQAIQQSGGQGLTGTAQAIRDATKVYDCQGRSGTDLSTCQAFLNTNAQSQAFSQNALNLLTQRVTQIQGLQSQINTTGDPKAIAELQARLTAEVAQVNNDSNRLAVLRAMADQQDRAAQQALKERELKNLALTSDGSETFHFQLP